MIVTRRVPVWHLTPALWRGQADLVYDTHDPYAVTVILYCLADCDCDGDGDGVAWSFGRDLLDAGMDRHAGLGDVRIWPDRSALMVALTGQTGQAVLRFRHDQVARFLLASYRAVPRGTERVDLDGLVGELLGGAS